MGLGGEWPPPVSPVPFAEELPERQPGLEGGAPLGALFSLLLFFRIVAYINISHILYDYRRGSEDVCAQFRRK